MQVVPARPGTLVWLNQQVLDLGGMRASIVEPSAKSTVTVANEHISDAKFAQPSSASTSSSFMGNIATARSAMTTVTVMEAGVLGFSPHAPVTVTVTIKRAPTSELIPLRGMTVVGVG